MSQPGLVKRAGSRGSGRAHSRVSSVTVLLYSCSIALFSSLYVCVYVMCVRVCACELMCVCECVCVCCM